MVALGLCCQHPARQAARAGQSTAPQGRNARNRTHTTFGPTDSSVVPTTVRPGNCSSESRTRPSTRQQPRKRTWDSCSPGCAERPPGPRKQQQSGTSAEPDDDPQPQPARPPMAVPAAHRDGSQEGHEGQAHGQASSESLRVWEAGARARGPGRVGGARGGLAKQCARQGWSSR